MTTGIVTLEENTEDSLGVLWTIGDLVKKLDENDTLQSDPFIFAGQKWRILLAAIDILDESYIDISLSRITFSEDETPISSSVCWNVGILDKDGISHYGHCGIARLETVFKEWMTVEDWPGPEIAYLCREKDLYMPEDKLTVVASFRLDFVVSLASLLTNAQDFTPKEANRDVLISVRGTKFHVQSSILETISDVMSVQTFCSEWDGDNFVMDFPDCDPSAFEHFLRFAYSGELATEELTDAVTEGVYYIADKFDVPKLKEACVRRLLSTLDIFSVCDVLDLAERYRDEKLKENATVFFIKNAHKILHTSKWLEFLKTRTTVANGLIIRCLKALRVAPVDTTGCGVDPEFDFQISICRSCDLCRPEAFLNPV